MNATTTTPGYLIQDKTRPTFQTTKAVRRLALIGALLLSFLFAGPVLRYLDPTAGVLDIGILSVLLFGLLSGALVIFCSLWIQEILWKPFKTIRQQFDQQFKQLTPWQQCFLYFAVFFLWLYALIYLLSIIL